MCDDFNQSSEPKGSASTTSPERRTSQSREQSPDISGAAEILEHSMESLLVSDSSEECISPSEVLAGEDEADGKQLAGENDSHAAEIQLQQQAPAEGNVEEKKKKKRLSSRRERKISLSGKVDGVKVNLQQLAVLACSG